MASRDALADGLHALEQEWQRIEAVPETPRSVLDVIEYSLASQRKGEVYVTRLLRYFLDPTEPHGLDDEFLHAFLDGLPAACGFEEDVHNAADVHVDRQVRVRAGPRAEGDEEDSSRGDVDLVLQVPNEWFMMIELKFGAGENNLRGDGYSQTEAYYRASQLGGRPTDAYLSGQYFLYLHPADERSAKEPNFANWTWEAFIEDTLRPFLETNAPRYPQRTVTQLRELTDDLQGFIGMSEQENMAREKVELYLDHHDVITDVTNAFEDRWETFTQNWDARLRDEIENSGHSMDAWHTYTGRDDWGHIFKDGWWRELETMDAISSRDKNYNDVRLSFIHRLRANRELAIGDRTLEFHFRNCGSNDQEFRDEFNRLVDEREDRIRRVLPDTAELTGERRNLVTARYDIRADEHEDFFAAYIAALGQALTDHAFGDDTLADYIEELYDEARGVYR